LAHVNRGKSRRRAPTGRHGWPEIRIERSQAARIATGAVQVLAETEGARASGGQRRDRSRNRNLGRAVVGGRQPWPGGHAREGAQPRPGRPARGSRKRGFELAKRGQHGSRARGLGSNGEFERTPIEAGDGSPHCPRSAIAAGLSVQL
jgi:hypothetical protein